MHENDISYYVRKCSFQAHPVLGPGLLESVYETALAFELRQIGYDVKTQVPLPMTYAGQRMDIGFRLDLLINTKVIVEIKPVDVVLDAHKKQLLTYLKLSGCKLGLLINFHVAHAKEEITCLVNGLEEEPPRTPA